MTYKAAGMTCHWRTECIRSKGSPGLPTIHQLVNSHAMTDTAKDLPARIADVAALEELMSRPSPELVQALEQVDGDLMVLGVGGKMGPTLARMAKRANPGRRVIGVA